MPYVGVTATDVMGPAIAAAWCLWLLLAVVTLSALWHVPGVPSGSGYDPDSIPDEPPSYESLSAQVPALLVRESSTLFRQVSARTLQAYNLRYGKLAEEEDDELPDLENGQASGERRIRLADQLQSSHANMPSPIVPEGSAATSAPTSVTPARRTPGEEERGCDASMAAGGAGGGASAGGAGSGASGCVAPPSTSPSAGASASSAVVPPTRGAGSSPVITPTSFSGRFRSSSSLLRGDKKKRGSGKESPASSGSPGGSGNSSGRGGVGGGAVEADGAEAASVAAEEGPNTPVPVEQMEQSPCWVCFADTVNDEAVLLHCGHAGLCLSCADNLWRRRLNCPMCRQPISLVAKVGDTVAVDGKLVVSPSLPSREALAATGVVRPETPGRE